MPAPPFDPALRDLRMNRPRAAGAIQKACTKPVCRNSYGLRTDFVQLVLVLDLFWTSSGPSHSCFRHAFALHSNGNQNMKTYRGSFIQSASQRQARRACRAANRSRNAGLPPFPFCLCALEQNLIAIRNIRQQANPLRTNEKTFSNRYFFCHFGARPAPQHSPSRISNRNRPGFRNLANQ